MKAQYWHTRSRNKYLSCTQNQKRSRKRFLAAVARTAGCIDCGYNADSAALDFDHVRGVKEGPLASACQWTWDRFITELMKCEVRCANCHRIATRERMF